MERYDEASDDDDLNFLFDDPERRGIGRNILRYPKTFMREMACLHMIYSRGSMTIREYAISVILNKAAWNIFTVECMKAPKRISLKRNGEPRKMRRSLQNLCDILGIPVPEGAETFSRHKIEFDSIFRKMLHVTPKGVFDEQDDYVKFLDASGRQTSYQSVWEESNSVTMVLSDFGLTTYKRLRICFERYHPVVRNHLDWEMINQRRSTIRFMRSRRATLEKSLNYEIACYNFYERYFAMITMYHYDLRGDSISDSSLDLNMKVFGTRRSKHPIKIDRFNLYYIDEETGKRTTIYITDLTFIKSAADPFAENGRRHLNGVGKMILGKLSRIYNREAAAFEYIKKYFPDKNFDVWEDEPIDESLP